MAGTGLLIELECVLLPDALAADAQAQLTRMHNAEIILGVVSQLAQADAESKWQQATQGLDVPALPVLGIAAGNEEKWQWPKAAQILRFCTEHGVDIFSSWVIAQNHDAFRAAAQAGFLGGIYIGENMPADSLGLRVLNQALSIGDAPRVMIPPDGGCWHNI